MQAAVSAARNPKGPSSGTFRVVRGTSWFYVSPSLFRAAFRIWYQTGLHVWQRGFSLRQGSLITLCPFALLPFGGSRGLAPWGVDRNGTRGLNFHVG